MGSNLTSQFEDALVFATQLHAGQVRKETEVPYVAHLLSVAALVIEAGGDEDEVIAALLHDAVEDQGGQDTLAQIKVRYGPRVAMIVAGCTDADTLPKPPWRARKEAYIAHLRTAPPDVRLVSCADKLHNARCILRDLRLHGIQAFEKFNGGQSGTLWYYRTLVELFQTSDDHFIVAELARVVAEIERLATGGEPGSTS